MSSNQFNLNLLHHYEHAQNQFNYLLNLKMPQILEFQDIKRHVHPKIIGLKFSFPDFVWTCKNLVYSINSFWRYSQF